MNELSLYARGATRITLNGRSVLLPVSTVGMAHLTALSASMQAYSISLTGSASQISGLWNSDAQTRLNGALTGQLSAGTTAQAANPLYNQLLGQANSQDWALTQPALSNQGTQQMGLGQYSTQFQATQERTWLQALRSATALINSTIKLT